jgi:hypothetical protein
MSPVLLRRPKLSGAATFWTSAAMRIERALQRILEPSPSTDSLAAVEVNATMTSR